MRCQLALFCMDDGEHQGVLRDDCLKAAARYGFPVRVFGADNDSQKQVAQIHECLREPPARRPTVVMVSPVREVNLRAVAYEAARLGVGWVVLTRWWDYVNNLHAEFPDPPIFAAVTDQKEIGRIQGAQLKALLPDGGELVYIQGPLGTSSAARRFAGVQEVLQDSATEVFTLHSDWTVEGGTRALLDWARVFQRSELPKFIVGAQNDLMAMGARSAVAELAKERPNFSSEVVSFCGCDGSPAYGQRLVTEGKLASTVVVPVGAGRAIAEIASMMLGGPRPRATIWLKPLPFPEPHLLDRSARKWTGATAAELAEVRVHSRPPASADLRIALQSKERVPFADVERAEKATHRNLQRQQSRETSAGVGGVDSPPADAVTVASVSAGLGMKPLSRTRKLDLLRHYVGEGKTLLSGSPQLRSRRIRSEDARTPLYSADAPTPLERWRDEVGAALKLVGAPQAWAQLTNVAGANAPSLKVTIELLNVLACRIEADVPLEMTSDHQEALAILGRLLTWGDHCVVIASGDHSAPTWQRADYEEFLLELPAWLEWAETFLATHASEKADIFKKTALIASVPLDVDTFVPRVNAKLWHAAWALWALAWWMSDGLGDSFTIHAVPCCSFIEVRRTREQWVAHGKVTCPRCLGDVGALLEDAQPNIELTSTSWSCSSCNIGGYFPNKAHPKSIWMVEPPKLTDASLGQTSQTPRTRSPTPKVHGLTDAWIGYSDEDKAEGMPLSKKSAFHRDLSEATTVEGSSLALLMLDADHFKAVNDNYGHPVGDKVLLALGQLVRDAVGRRGRGYRYGGEEVAVLLPHFTAAEAMAVAERIRLAVEMYAWGQVVAGLSMTLSIGVAELGTGEGAAEDLLKRADDALYAAKRMGRNRVCAAGALPEGSGGCGAS
jgi:diguanylate cyclase (GGDEF)-like protein